MGERFLEMTFSTSSSLMLVNVTKLPCRNRKPIIIIANGKRLAALARQHGHEAEHAGVDAGAHTVEDGVVKRKPPVLSGEALEHAGSRRAVG